jgi:transcriptional regulator with XRE-family HTH domain
VQPIPGDDFASRLDHLWGNVYPKSQGRPYTYEEVARAMKARGVSVTPQYLQQLRTGRRTDPRQSYVAALAGFFGVPVEYFFSGKVADEISWQIAELAEIRDSLQRAEASREAPEHAIALRAQGLSPRSIRAIASLVDQARELEGLPPVRPDPQAPTNG